MKPALYRRPVAYWAAPEVIYTVSRPTVTSRVPHVEIRLRDSLELIGVHWLDGILTTTLALPFYHIT